MAGSTAFGEGNADARDAHRRTMSQALAAYIANERLENIDRAARDKIKWIIVHHVGLSFRGLRGGEADAMRAVAVARELGDGLGTSTIIGQSFRAPLVEAAAANCQLMRSYSQDDVLLKTGVHPALVTLPVALGIAERHRLGGADLMTALAVGYEMLGKFAQWTWALAVPRRATMPFGPFGCMATAARLLGFGEERTTVALAYAAHNAMGLAEHDFGPISHYYSMVCRNGIAGAYYTKAGAWGSETVLEGRFGFIDAFLGGQPMDIDAVVSSMGSNYAVLDITEKRYPGTGLNQVPIEQMRALLREHRLGPADIARIHVSLPRERENFEAGHGTGPFLPGTAPSSIAYHFAMLILDGDLDPARYSQVTNPAILALVARTRFAFVPDKAIRYSRVEIETTDGRRLVEEGDFFAFEPYTLEQIMRRDAAAAIPDAAIDRFLEMVDRLEELDDVGRLMACLRPQG
jgi:2-methylcitrate dehydratase PrpD